MNKDNKNSDIPDLNSILLLTDEHNGNSTIILNKEILKINHLIKLRYQQVLNPKNIINNKEDKKFLDIKKSALELNDEIKKQTIHLSSSIENHKKQLKKLHREEVLFDQNKIQLDIISNQEILINDYKKNIDELKLNLNNEKDQLKNTTQINQKLSNNNIEFKNLIRRFVKHNKNLQNNIQLLKKDFNEALLSKSKLNEMIVQIKFYQDENTRLSNMIINIKKDYELIKNNFNEVEIEKDNIYKKVKELNNSLTKNNVIGTPFVKKSFVEDSINAKILNDISVLNLKKDEIEIDEKKDTTDLDKQINNIFN